MYLVCAQFVHGRSRMAVDPRIPTMSGQCTSSFHVPGRQVNTMMEGGYEEYEDGGGADGDDAGSSLPRIWKG